MRNTPATMLSLLRAPSLLLVVAGAAAGCSQAPPPPPATDTTPAAAPATPERLEADDPRAGMNNTRPDSVEDVKPEPGTPDPVP
jgi:hypothetical protein